MDARAGDPLRVRPMTADDHPGVDRILAANDESVEADGAWPYLDCVGTCGRAVVGELGGSLVGFAAVVTVGRTAHVSDLFVDPAHQGAGVGGRLLDVVLGGDWPRSTFSSADPRALPVYIRRGMRPGWPGFYVSGPAPDPTVGGPALTVERIAATTMTDVERAISGVDRGCLHRYEAREPGSVHLAVRVGDRYVAAGHARDARKEPGRWLDRLVVGPEVDPLAAVLAALRAAAVPGLPVGACVPGPHPALAILLGAGHRIVDRDTYCESEPGLFDPTRSLPDPALL